MDTGEDDPEWMAEEDSDAWRQWMSPYTGFAAFVTFLRKIFILTHIRVEKII